MGRTKRISLNFVSKISKEIRAMYLLQMKLLTIFYYQENIDGLNQVIHTIGQKQSTQKNSRLGVFSSKGIIKLQFFTANMDSKKYVEILKNCKPNIDNLHPNSILLLKDNSSKNKSKMSIDYYILKTKYICSNGQHIFHI